MTEFKLKNENLDVAEIQRFLHDDACGAHIIFTGSVRNSSKGKEVLSLEFEAYEPMAIAELNKIAEELKATWPVSKIIVHHRLGKVKAGEVVIIAGVSSPHRAEAFAACEHLMNRLKQTVPIWKKEIFGDGEEWVSPHP